MTDLFGDGPPAGSREYAEAYARRTDPEQSHAAARRVDANKLEGIVVAALLMFGPLTVKQVASRVGRHEWSISPRMKPLERKKLVYRYAKNGRETIWAAR